MNIKTGKENQCKLNNNKDVLKNKKKQEQDVIHYVQKRWRVKIYVNSKKKK